MNGLILNMDTLNRLTAPATAKIRQLQKIVQDIKKNDGSFLDKLRRLKSKTRPSVPARDYRDDIRENDQSSEPDYDNDTYEDLHEDDSYEPPPSHRAFTTAFIPSLPRGEYLDSCRERPSRPPKKPLRPAKGSKQLPPEPPHLGSDDEDYIDPDATIDDDNYIEPAENPSPNPMVLVRNRAGVKHHTLPTHLSERPPSPDFYEVPDKEDTSPPPPASRLGPTPGKQSHSLPKPCPRINTRASPHTIQEPTGEDQYEVCDPQDSAPPPPRIHKPLPKERSAKPPVVPKPDLKPREFERKLFPVDQTDLKPPPKAFSLDLKRPKFPFPQFTPPKPGGSGAVENGSTELDKDADVSNKPWFAAACDRRTADDVLLSSNKDGAFMVRKSSGQDVQQPYTLVVFYSGRVYNIPIRFIPSTKQYALGREKKGEEYFSSVSHIIENHQRNLLVLIDSQNNTKDSTKLCHPMKP